MAKLTKRMQSDLAGKEAGIHQARRAYELAQTGLDIDDPDYYRKLHNKEGLIMAGQQTSYERGFYDGSRGLTAAYYPQQEGNPHDEYQRGFREGSRERNKLNSRPINTALKPSFEIGCAAHGFKFREGCDACGAEYLDSQLGEF